MRRDSDELRARVCIGSAGHCANLLSRYAAAGCRRIHVWPLDDQPDQLSRLFAQVLPQI